MSKAIWWLIVILGAGLFGLIVYHALPPPTAEQVVPPAPAASLRPPESIEPQIQHPIRQVQKDKPLPALDVSDATMKSALVELLSDGSIMDVLRLRDFVRRVVATIDNLPRNKIAARLSPLKPVSGKFLVAGKNGSLAIGTDNAARYAVYVRLANALDAEKAVALYARYYPLFQQAYGELGYPKGYFNDRLIEVIDHLLATPEVKAPPGLVQPKVLYLYAAPELEALSAGQKILIRMGGENAAQIKAKLREIRSQLTRGIPAGPAASPAR